MVLFWHDFNTSSKIQFEDLLIEGNHTRSSKGLKPWLCETTSWNQLHQVGKYFTTCLQKTIWLNAIINCRTCKLFNSWDNKTRNYYINWECSTCRFICRKFSIPQRNWLNGFSLWRSVSSFIYFRRQNERLENAIQWAPRQIDFYSKAFHSLHKHP